MEKVFFAFPFDFGVDYRLVTQRACNDFSLTAVFGDDVRRADALIQKLCTAIDDCRFGFYDITGFNPNVMVELGIGFCSKRTTFIMFNEQKHKNTPAVKAMKSEVPADLQGHERFTYRTPEDLDRELRKTLRQALGIGQNSAYELKERIRKVLNRNPQPIRRIVESLGAPERDVQDALAAMRFEKRVALEGHGAGAKWRLVAH